MILLIPVVAFPQQNGWTPEQQEQFRKQMEDFQEQLQQQMQQLRESLSQMQENLKQQDWSAFDSANWDFNFSQAPFMPDTLVMPTPPEMDMIDINPDDDSTEVHIGKWNLKVEEGDDGNDRVRVYKENDCEDEEDYHEMKNIKTRFLLLDIGLNNYFTGNLSSNFPTPYKELEPVPGKSLVVDLHIFNQRVNLIAHHLWLSYGAYVEFNTYKFSGNEILIPRLDSVALQEYESGLKKNKLSCEYVGIPLMLRFESNPHNEDKSFHIAAGGFGEYLMGAHTKIKTTSNEKLKQHDDFNLSRFRYGITGRIGYAWVNLFVNYCLSDLFETGTGPVLTPASAGLAFEF